MEIKIVPYSEVYKSYFKSLNLEWLNKYFHPTDADIEILDHPERILAKGGQVFFALHDEEVAGTCACIPHGKNSYELIKMGVSARFQGKGIGLKLIQAVVKEAKEHGKTEVMLETASSLKAAVSLYTKSGFTQVGPEEIHKDFGRKTFKMVMPLEN